MVTAKNKNLVKTVLDLAYKNKLSHLSSSFSSLDIIDYIYQQKEQNDIFILSSGHAALALYAVLQKYKNINAEEIFNKHGGHPHLDLKNDIHCSTGSLGMGITVAVGRALANKNRKVYCLISDGECAEGSVWESLKTIKEKNIKNIEIHCNCNGFAAYDEVDINYLESRLKVFLPDIKIHKTCGDFFPFINGLNGHYHIMSEGDYNLSLSMLEKI